MKRRSFFKSLMGAVAAVAIAPEIAFRRKLTLPAVEAPVFMTTYWMETTRHSACYTDEYIAAIQKAAWDQMGIKKP